MQIILAIILAAGMPAEWITEFSSGNWEEARVQALLVAAADTTDADAVAALSLSEAFLGNNVEASALAAEAVSLDSLSPLAWVAMGRATVEHDINLSLQHFERSLELDPGITLGKVGKAHCHALSGDYKRAERELDEAMALDSSWISLWLELIMVLEYQQDYPGAYDTIQSALELWPDNRLLLIEKGWLQELDGKLDAALSTYRLVADLFPDDTEGLLNIGLLQESLGYYGEAVKSYRELLSRDSTDYWSCGEIGICLESVGNTGGAVISYLRGIQLNPDYSFALYRLGGLAEVEGEFNEAIQWYIQCVESDPAFIDAGIALGLLYEDRGSFQAAEAAYRTVLQHDSLNTWTWGELGLVLEQMGRSDEAGEAYENGIAVDADYLWAWEQRGLLFENAGDLEAASRWYQLAVDSTEPGPWLFGELGYVLEQLNQHDSAIVCYTEAVELDTMYLFGFQRLAPLMADAGDRQQALDIWERFMNAGGDPSTALCEMVLLMEASEDPSSADSLKQILADQYPYGWIDLAWAYAELDPEKSLDLARRSSQSVIEDDHLFWTLVAGLYGHLGEFRLADSSYAVAAAIAPDSVDIWLDWGYFLFDEGMEELAAEKYRKVIELDSLSFSGWSSLGEALLFSDQYDPAIEAFHQAFALDANSPWLIAYMGLAFEQMGYSDKALDYYFQSLSISPGYDYAENRIREIADTGFDPQWNRREARRFNVTLFGDLRTDNGNVRERNYSAGGHVSYDYDTRGSTASLDAEYSFIETSKDYASDFTWSTLTLSLDRILSDHFSAKASSSWDRQPGTVRPWQISSYLSFDYSRWVNSWLWVSPGLGIGQVNTHWASGVDNERTDRTTIYGSLACWVSIQEPLWPTLWLWGDFYLPPEDPDNILMNGLAEVSVEMWDPLSLTLGYSIGYTGRPIYRYWDKYDTEFYMRLNLRVF